MRVGCVSGRAEKTGAPCQPPACPGVRLRARLRSRCFKCGTLRLCSPVAKCWHQTRQREAVGLNPGSDNESLHTTQCLLTATILPLLTCYCLLCSPSTLTTVCSPRCCLCGSPHYCLCSAHHATVSAHHIIVSTHHATVSALLTTLLSLLTALSLLTRLLSAHHTTVCSAHHTTVSAHYATDCP